MKRSFIREILEHTSSDTISFAGGLPDALLFPTIELQRATQTALADNSIWQYSTSTGYTPLKALIAQMYSDKGFPTLAEEILITSGSQQGLDIICRYHSGASITIESPSYLGALNIFKLNKMHIHSIPLGIDGIELATFKKSIEKTDLAYLIPDFQNPSGTCYSVEHREEIAKLLGASDTLLIEDSPYSELYFDKPYQSISQALPKQSYHLGSFSKVLAPALRIGWIRTDIALLTPLIAYKEAMDLHTSSITQAIAYEYLKDTEQFKEHLETLRSAYKKKMLYFANTLDEILPSFEYTRPKGGMFIYGRFEGVDTMHLVQKCLKKGVVFVPGSEFGGKADEIRFNFTHSSFTQIREGLERIKSVLDAYT